MRAGIASSRNREFNRLELQVQESAVMGLEKQAKSSHGELLSFSQPGEGTPKFPAVDPASQGGSEDKESACSVGGPGSVPALGRSAGEGHRNPLQDSCLENPTDRGAWRAAVHGVTKSQTPLRH